ncbi:hypothetical protein [Streptococcus halotolerans]|uniref:hypothetical protein n=1 Tax=Streptococcus halotolerans TaxID=1814128 RepID=UPI000787EE37|nr:hypothetical protein [Streptococcus halotolerans]
MIKTVTSSLELEDLLKTKGDLALIVSGNQCSIASLELGNLISRIQEDNLPIYQADIFQVPRLISLFDLEPTVSTFLQFRGGQVILKKEV